MTIKFYDESTGALVLRTSTEHFGRPPIAGDFVDWGDRRFRVTEVTHVYSRTGLATPDGLSTWRTFMRIEVEVLTDNPTGD